MSKALDVPTVSVFRMQLHMLDNLLKQEAFESVPRGVRELESSLIKKLSMSYFMLEDGVPGQEEVRLWLERAGYLDLCVLVDGCALRRFYYYVMEAKKAAAEVHKLARTVV